LWLYGSGDRKSLLQEKKMKVDEELIVKLIFGIAIVAMWSIISHIDYHNSLQEEKIYIENVCNGHYPNYKKWDIDCGTEKLKLDR
jgi:hypothetical protein